MNDSVSQVVQVRETPSYTYSISVPASATISIECAVLHDNTEIDCKLLLYSVRRQSITRLVDHVSAALFNLRWLYLRFHQHAIVIADRNLLYGHIQNTLDKLAIHLEHFEAEV